MNYGTIKWYDISNGPGVRVSLYVSGCRNHCKNCFNPETWSFEYGRPFTKEEEDKILKGMEPDYIKGFSLLGGDPFEPENQLALVDFMERLKRAYPNKSVWAYTGYDFEADLLTGKKGNPEVTMRLLRCIDVLVDGRFVEELKNPDLLFRGSSNQRILDLAAMRACASLLEGEHDFAAFSAAGSSAQTTVRTLYSVRVAEGEELGVPVLHMDFCGNGFLYNMVRILAGALLDAGGGRLTLSAAEQALRTGNRELLGKTLPAKGLTLLSVEYGFPLFARERG